MSDGAGCSLRAMLAVIVALLLVWIVTAVAFCVTGRDQCQGPW